MKDKTTHQQRTPEKNKKIYQLEFKFFLKYYKIIYTYFTIKTFEKCLHRSTLYLNTIKLNYFIGRKKRSHPNGQSSVFDW